jgi:hypothetical protein
MLVTRAEDPHPNPLPWNKGRGVKKNFCSRKRGRRAVPSRERSPVVSIYVLWARAIWTLAGGRCGRAGEPTKTIDCVVKLPDMRSEFDPTMLSFRIISGSSEALSLTREKVGVWAPRTHRKGPVEPGAGRTGIKSSRDRIYFPFEVN